MWKLQLFLFNQGSDCVVINYLTILFSMWNILLWFNRNLNSFPRETLKLVAYQLKKRTTGWEPLIQVECELSHWCHIKSRYHIVNGNFYFPQTTPIMKHLITIPYFFHGLLVKIPLCWPCCWVGHHICPC